MRIKSYFAATVVEAINSARNELGPDAMIVASRRTGPEAMHLGSYEVVFSVTDDVRTQPAAPEPGLTPAVPSMAPASADASVEDGRSRAAGLTRLRRQVDSIKGTFAAKKGSNGAASTSFESSGLSEAQSALLQAGFGAGLTDELLQAGKRRTRREGGGSDSVREALAEELKARLQVSAELGRPRAARQVVALVGPPGGGKTSMLVKLAASYGLRGRRAVHIISMDSYRLGKADQLRTYAAAMGVAFDALETVAALSQALEEYRSKGLIFIDTPGIGGADAEEAAPLASFLSRHPEADVHLVLPAYLSAEHMERTAQRFRPFLPSKLIFTNLDDVGSTGCLLSQSIRTETPISFVADGQQVPEDFEEARAEKLVGAFLPKLPVSAGISAA